MPDDARHDSSARNTSSPPTEDELLWSLLGQRPALSAPDTLKEVILRRVEAEGSDPPAKVIRRTWIALPAGLAAAAALVLLLTLDGADRADPVPSLVDGPPSRSTVVPETALTPVETASIAADASQPGDESEAESADWEAYIEVELMLAAVDQEGFFDDEYGLLPE